jgi:hypothetical protein
MFQIQLDHIIRPPPLQRLFLIAGRVGQGEEIKVWH